MFVIRTVKNGRVKIGKEYFYPEDKFRKYDGRLEGLRIAFGLYKDFGETRHKITYCGEKYLDLIYMWGTEAEYTSCSLPEDQWINDSELYTAKDGTLPFQIWRTK
jgi:hypothetical protein